MFYMRARRTTRRWGKREEEGDEGAKGHEEKQLQLKRKKKEEEGEVEAFRPSAWRKRKGWRAEGR